MNPEGLLAHYEQIADAPDAVSRLCHLTLDLAVRGKIVPQDPNDQPASELIADTLKTRKRLESMRKIRPAKLPYGPILLGDFALPNGWVRSNIIDLCDLQTGATPSSSRREFYGGEIRWLVSGDINKGEITECDGRISQLGLENSNCKVLPIGSVMIALNGQGKTRGKTAILRITAACNQSLVAIIPLEPSLLVPEYLRLCLMTHYDAIRKLTGGNERRGLNMRLISCFSIGIPPTAEQRRIVAKVDELMALYGRLEAARESREAARDRLAVASLSRLNQPDPENFQKHARFALDALPALSTRPDQIKQIRQTILNLAVRGKLVPRDPNDGLASELLKEIAKEKARLVGEKKLKRQTDLVPVDNANIPFDVSSGWSWSKAGDVFLNVTDGFHNTPSPVTEGYPYITAKHIRPGKVDFENCLYVDARNHRELFSKTRVKRGDILIVNIGAGCGTPAMVDVDYEFSFKNVAVVNLPSIMDGKFVLLFLLYYRDLVFDELIKGGAQPFLGLGTLREMLIPLPPLAEQQRIVTKVDSLVALCDQLEANLTATATTRRRLLDALLAEAFAPTATKTMTAAE